MMSLNRMKVCSRLFLSDDEYFNDLEKFRDRLLEARVPVVELFVSQKKNLRKAVVKVKIGDEEKTFRVVAKARRSRGEP